MNHSLKEFIRAVNHSLKSEDLVDNGDMVFATTVEAVEEIELYWAWMFTLSYELHIRRASTCSSWFPREMWCY